MAKTIILLVEDNPDDEILALRAFSRSNGSYKVIVAHDGAEALDYLFARGGYAGRDPCELPQLILLDLKLPKVDGFEVLRQLRANTNTSHVPVVILTSSDEERDILESYHLHANSFIRKPVDFVQFVETIKQVSAYWLGLNTLPRTYSTCSL